VVDKDQITYRGRNFIDYKKWNKDDTETLVSLVGSIPTIEISNQLGRTRNETQHKLKRLGISPVKMKFEIGLKMMACLQNQGYTPDQINFVLGEGVNRYL